MAKQIENPYIGQTVIHGKDGAEHIPFQVDSNGKLYVISSGGAIALSRKESSQDLSVAPLSYTTDFSNNVKIKGVKLHASTNITETINVNFKSKTGVNYDTKLISKQLTNQQDFFTNEEITLESGDQLTVSCTNVGSTGTIYLTIIGEVLS